MIFQQGSHSQGLRSRFTRLGTFTLLGLTLLLAACGGSSGNGSTGAGTGCPSTKSLNGGGSTFINPLFSKMFTEYPNAKCGANVNYQSIGSGAGINNLLQGIVDFGATDSPMTDDQLAKSTHGPIVHIPVTLGTEAIVYNLPGIPSGKLKLTGPIITNIYLGKVTSWDDPSIKQINPDLSLSKLAISVAHRSDGSGTTSIFTHYLSAISPGWQSKVGAGTTVNWPVGVGGKGNDGVAAVVRQTAGAIGYVELAYAVKNSIPFASLQNAAGNFLEPSLGGGKAAAASVTTIPDDLRFFIVNAPGAASYPVSGFVWVVVYQHQTNADKGQAVANMLWWVIHDGQQYSAPLTYVPLPAPIVTRGEAKIKSMTCGSDNSPCYKG
ncbi:MAG TPA: phosphate ABC transporter substrate-binding protein PstS [Ktedonobacteraceae bacterium]|nr:phosphate ABC transporter substrate-binding protein PstS [Ktedonobacteraceae bacterium]